MSGIRTFKKGEYLFKEGDKVTSIFLIQSGSVHVQFLRGKQKIEYYTATTNMILGEHVLSGQATHPASALAHVETKVIEIPIDAFKEQLATGTQISKALFKGMLDKVKMALTDLKGSRLERDSSPCPPEQTPKAFGVLYHSFMHKAENKNGKLTADFRNVKVYAQRIFMESPKRVEQVASIFVKLKHAEFQMTKDENDPDAKEEIGFLHFTDVLILQEFFEYYQYYHFKPGKGELLKVDENAMSIVSCFLKCAEGVEADRVGMVRLDYTKVVETLKEDCGLELKGDHFSLLEMKGLMCKRQATDQGVFLQFELMEFRRVFRVWTVLRELQKWNDTGKIDMNDIWKPVKKVVHNGPICPACEAPTEKDHKFCAACGHKLQAAA